MSRAPVTGRWRLSWRLVLSRDVASAFGIGCTATCFDLVNAPLTLFAVSRQLVGITINTHKNMNTKTPECWASDPNAHGVKIELSAERSLLLPFDQFAFAELKTEGKQQHLRLVFATHEVSVRGNALRRIETTMQRMELSFLAALSSSERKLIAEGQPVIVEIVVTETDSQPKRGENGHGALQ